MGRRMKQDIPMKKINCFAQKFFRHMLNEIPLILFNSFKVIYQNKYTIQVHMHWAKAGSF